MADHMRAALAKLLDEYDARKRGELAREQKTRDDDAQFLKQFAELRASVIRPVFEAAGEVLEGRGHRFSIAEQESVAGAAGRISEAGISLRVIPSGTRAPVHEDQRSLSIATRHYNKTVWINSGESPNSGGVAGAKGAYALDKVTSALVEAEVLAFVARVIAA